MPGLRTASVAVPRTQGRMNDSEMSHGEELRTELSGRENQCYFQLLLCRVGVPRSELPPRCENARLTIARQPRHQPLHGKSPLPLGEEGAQRIRLFPAVQTGSEFFLSCRSWKVLPPAWRCSLHVSPLSWPQHVENRT